jgi:hypothetical protein
MQRFFLALHNNFRHYSEDGYYAIHNTYDNDIYLYVDEKNLDDITQYLTKLEAKVLEINDAKVNDYVDLNDISTNIVMNQFVRDFY